MCIRDRNFNDAIGKVYTQNRIGLEGLDAWDANANEAGAVEISSTGKLLIYPTNTALSEDFNAEAILTLNLSNYEISEDDILLDLDFASNVNIITSAINSNDELANAIWVRGADTDEWLLVSYLERNQETTRLLDLPISLSLIHI